MMFSRSVIVEAGNGKCLRREREQQRLLVHFQSYRRVGGSTEVPQKDLQQHYLMDFNKNVSNSPTVSYAQVQQICNQIEDVLYTRRSS